MHTRTARNFQMISKYEHAFQEKKEREEARAVCVLKAEPPPSPSRSTTCRQDHDPDGQDQPRRGPAHAAVADPCKPLACTHRHRHEQRAGHLSPRLASTRFRHWFHSTRHLKKRAALLQKVWRHHLRLPLDSKTKEGGSHRE